MLNVNILNGGNVSQASGGSSDNQLGIINVAADFPTTSEANASIGQGYYLIGANVTDNDPTKTNTGDSFVAGNKIEWTGSAWVIINEGYGVQTVTGDIVDNTDPLNPVVNLPADVVLTSGAQTVSDKTLTNTSIQGGGGSELSLARTTILDYMTWVKENNADVLFGVSNTANIYLDQADSLLHIKYESPNEDTFVLENAVQPLTNKTIGLITETFNSPAFNITSTAAVSENPNTATQQSQATTTDDTPTFLTFVSLPISSSCVKITADILAVRTGGAGGNPVDTFATTIVGTFKNIAGTITQVGTTDVIGEVSDIIGATAEFVIDGLNVRVVVTGVVDYNITWNANEVKFSTIQL